MGMLARRWTVELKVVAMTVAVAAAGGAAAILNQVEADHSMLGSTPAWLQAVLLVVTPTGTAFLTGWAARHTPRPDLDAPHS